MSDVADLLAVITPEFDSLPQGPLGVAVSGGGDSLALLHLLHSWGKRPLLAVTVDHGLRPAAVSEAAQVAAVCDSLGIAHTVLRWRNWNGQGNLQDAARRARQQLIAAWAGEAGISAVALGHTADDQAETFLMRLARGSGVDGLAAMGSARQHGALTWLRPLLRAERATLRAYLQDIGQSWADDPSNDDPQFTRIRMRRAAPQLAELGLDKDVLTATAAQMRRARIALDFATRQLAENVALASAIGMITLNRHDYGTAPEELRLRLLSGALGWIGGAEYRPRLDSLSALDAQISKHDATGRCLQGVQIIPEGETVLMVRETAACDSLTLTEDTDTLLWDGRWRFFGDLRAGDEIAPLGAAGLTKCSDWRDSGWPRAALMATPGHWRDGRLIAAPMVVNLGNLRCSLEGGAKAFYEALITR
ncbi:MAG: tRNA lysidine(34) synthetase TilS [Paracoccaceae bacterium]